jgi:hypothetical protein
MPTTEAPPALHRLRDQPRLAHHRARLVQRLAVALRDDCRLDDLTRDLAAADGASDVLNAYRVLLAAQIAHHTTCRRHRLTKAEAERLAELAGIWTLEAHVTASAVRDAMAGTSYADLLTDDDWVYADEMLETVTARGRRLAARTRRGAACRAVRPAGPGRVVRGTGRRGGGRPAGRRVSRSPSGAGDDDPGPSPRARGTGAAS